MYAFSSMVYFYYVDIILAVNILQFDLMRSNTHSYLYFQGKTWTKINIFEKNPRILQLMLL